MQQHRGRILEAIIRRSGYSLTSLTERLGISRNTIYNKLRQHDLSYEFILEVGNIIHYDFTTEFPEIKPMVSIDKEQHAAKLWRLEKKYTHLLERYNTLLSFLIKLAHNHNLEKLKKDIDQLEGRVP